ncbi:MFS transporter [Metarhizium album ARSEF 1941]|uniref:MFS transporter n=1 Tax=Metarhizium album (strain ARSEF 1941) TaxID=1081103 RepID=A0A0B2WX63_METAS|nr:MFS transporter [Metarhizium album ARSEF 1941]KHN98022.1 MFS transporter [Metarhizium album ARSEF 1941]
MKKDVQRHDQEELQQRARDVLHIEILPGTEIMTDAPRRDGDEDLSASHAVLVPQPSDSAHDPLSWSPFWKASAIVASSSVTFTQGFASLALAPMFPFLMDDFNRSLADVIKFTGVIILILGFSNFVWQVARSAHSTGVPLATSKGRRVVLIASQVLCLASYIWRAKATSYTSFMGSIILNGVGAGPAETLQPTVIADLFFLDDRGKWNTLYWVIYMGSLMIAPVISGTMAEHSGWPSFFWLCAGLTSLSLLIVLFGFPETIWHRARDDGRGSGNGDWAAKSSDPALQDVVHDAREPGRPQESWIGRGRPNREQWQIFQTTPLTWRLVWHEVWMPWRIFLFPIVLFASFAVSWSCSGLLIINLTQSQVFSAPPYNWSAQSVGFTSLPLFVGAIIGLVTAGPFSDWVCARATARNGGVREPEMRLPAMIPYIVLMMLGHVVPAIGYQQKWPWQAIVIVGYTCTGIQVAGLPSIASTYAVDSYKPVAGALFVAITVNKNVWGYGMAEFVTAWSEEAGYVRHLNHEPDV